MWSALILLALLLLPQAGHAEDAAMRASLQAFFARGVQVDGAKAELIDVVRWPDAKGKLRWHLPHLAGHPRQVSMIAEQGKGQNARRWYVPVRVHWWTNAVAVKDDVPPRTLLDASMLERVRSDIAGYTGNWWGSVDQVVGTRTTRPLHAGDVIYSSYVIRPPLLRRGDMVTLIAHIGGITVTTMGKVLRQAGRGDTVRVQNMRSKQILQATIVNKNTAYVYVGGGAG